MGALSRVLGNVQNTDDVEKFKDVVLGEVLDHFEQIQIQSGMLIETTSALWLK